MIGIALALALAGQDMTQADMIAEGQEIGRASVAMGLCDRLGYTVYSETGRRWAEGFGERGLQSGWSEHVLRQAIQSGTALETADLDLEAPSHDGDDAAFSAAATALFQRMKDRCHRLAREHAGLISGLEAGDRNADAELATLLAPLGQ